MGTCVNNHVEATQMLLTEAKGIVEVDLEDARRQTPDMLTKNETILAAVREYRDSVDKKKQKILMYEYAFEFAKTQASTELKSVFNMWADIIKEKTAATGAGRSGSGEEDGERRASYAPPAMIMSSVIT